MDVHVITDILDNVCQEKFAYDGQYIVEQLLELEKQGWLVIEKK